VSKKYDLVGVDGNAYAIMGYTARALKREGLRDLVEPMHREATSTDYDNLLRVCMGYLDKANNAADERGNRMRLIDADRLKEEIVEEGQRSTRYRIGEFWELNRDEIWKVIDEQPTAEERNMKRNAIDADALDKALDYVPIRDIKKEYGYIYALVSFADILSIIDRLHNQGGAT